MRTPRVWGAAAGGLLTVVLFGLSAAPVAAELTDNKIGCSGSARITAPGGKSYEVNADDKTATVPREGTAAWEGGIDTVTHNHHGEVKVKLPFGSVVVGDWGPSKNEKDENTKAGTKTIPDALKQLPAGKYVVTGFHQGDEGRCSGSITLEVDGSPFDTPAGIVSAAATVIFGGLMGLAAKVRG